MSIEIKPIVNTDAEPLKMERDKHVPIIVSSDRKLKLAIANLMMDAFMDGSFLEYDDTQGAIGYDHMKTGNKSNQSHHQNYLKLRKGYR